MSFRCLEADGRSTLYLAGEIDLERSPAAREALLAAVRKGRPVVVDLAEVSYMDSSGIASLVEAYQAARRRGIEFSLTGVGDAVHKVLRLARLDQVLPIR